MIKYKNCELMQFLLQCTFYISKYLYIKHTFFYSKNSLFTFTKITLWETFVFNCQVTVYTNIFVPLNIVYLLVRFSGQIFKVCFKLRIKFKSKFVASSCSNIYLITQNTSNLDRNMTDQMVPSMRCQNSQPLLDVLEDTLSSVAN